MTTMIATDPDGLTFREWCAVESEYEWFVCGDCGLIVTPGTHRALGVLGHWFAQCLFEYSAALAFA